MDLVADFGTVSVLAEEALASAIDQNPLLVGLELHCSRNEGLVHLADGSAYGHAKKDPRPIACHGAHRDPVRQVGHDMADERVVVDEPAACKDDGACANQAPLTGALDAGE